MTFVQNASGSPPSQRDEGLTFLDDENQPNINAVDNASGYTRKSHADKWHREESAQAVATSVRVDMFRPSHE